MNKYENMQIIALDDIEDVYNAIHIELAELEEDSKDYIVVYGKRDLIGTLFEMMIDNGCKFRYADFDFIDEMLKDRVYMMFVHIDYTVSVEPACNKKGEVTEHDAKTALIYMEDCAQNIIDYCVNSNKNVILFDFDGNKCDCTECCGCCHCDDNELANTSTEKYFVNDELVSKDVFNEYDKLIGSKIKEIEEGMNLFRQMMFGF